MPISNKILVNRRTPEEREKNHMVSINKMIQKYIKDGCKGNLDLTNVPIRSLPDSLKVVGGNLSLFGAYIEYLPDNLKVFGTLSITKTLIKTLPKGLEVQGNFMAGDCEITSFPSDIKLGADIFLSYSKIQILPDNLTINGNLIMGLCRQFKKLPNNLRVIGYLDCNGTGIKSLPKDLVVENWINIDDTPLKFSIRDEIYSDGPRRYKFLKSIGPGVQNWDL